MEKKTMRSLISDLNSGRINDEDCCLLAEMLFDQPDCDRSKPYSVLEKGAKRKFPKTMSNLGWYCLSDGRPGADAETNASEEAVIYLQKSKELFGSAKAVKTCASLGLAYIRVKKYPEAVRALHVAATDLKDASVLNNLGVAEYYMGKFSAAEDNFRLALAAGKTDTEKMQAGFNLAAALASQGKTEEAVAAIDAANAFAECEAVDKYDLARLYYTVKCYDKVCAVIPESKVNVVPNVRDFAAYAASLFEIGRKDELTVYLNEVSAYCRARQKESIYDATEKKYEDLLGEITNAYSQIVKGLKPEAAPDVREIVGNYRY